MAGYHIFQDETIAGLADEARRLGGVTGKLTIAEMLDTFGGTVPVKNQDITITENGTYTAEDGFTGFGTVVVEVSGGVSGLPENAEIIYFGSANSSYIGGSIDFEVTAAAEVTE